MDEAAILCPEEVPNIYNDAKKLQQTHEDPLYYSGRFFDKIIGKNYEEKELDGQGDIVYHIISQYVRSLLYGCNHLHQSLARLLSVSFLELHRKYINTTFYCKRAYCNVPKKSRISVYGLGTLNCWLSQQRDFRVGV